jgi:hypothetical protein
MTGSVRCAVERVYLNLHRSTEHYALRYADIILVLLTDLRVKVKVKVTPEQATKPREGTEVYLYSIFNLGTKSGGWSTPRPGRFTPGKDPLLTVQEAGWAPGPEWTGAEKAPTGIQSSDRTASSESLYRLSYRGLRFANYHGNISV